VSNFGYRQTKYTNNKLNPDIGVSGLVIVTLTAPYLSKGHPVYTDNWYTNPVLSLFLHELDNRKVMSPLSQNLLTGEVQSVTSDSLVAMKWCDRQDVRMLSTLHSDEIGNTGKCERKTRELVMKPKCMVD
jgi:hypothetical protein